MVETQPGSLRCVRCARPPHPRPLAICPRQRQCRARSPSNQHRCKKPFFDKLKSRRLILTDGHRGRFSVGSREWAPPPPIWPGVVAEARTEGGGAVGGEEEEEEDEGRCCQGVLQANPTDWNSWRLHWPSSRRPLLASNRRMPSCRACDSKRGAQSRPMRSRLMLSLSQTALMPNSKSTWISTPTERRWSRVPLSRCLENWNFHLRLQLPVTFFSPNDLQCKFDIMTSRLLYAAFLVNAHPWGEALVRSIDCGSGTSLIKIRTPFNSRRLRHRPPGNWRLATARLSITRQIRWNLREINCLIGIIIGGSHKQRRGFAFGYAFTPGRWSFCQLLSASRNAVCFGDKRASVLFVFELKCVDLGRGRRKRADLWSISVRWMNWLSLHLVLSMPMQYGEELSSSSKLTDWLVGRRDWKSEIWKCEDWSTRRALLPS